MKLQFEDVSSDPEQVARARRAPEAEEVLAAEGFELVGFVRQRFENTGPAAMHPDVLDAVLVVWRSADGTVLAEVDHMYGADVVTLWSLSAEGHQVKTVFWSVSGILFGAFAPHDPAAGPPRPSWADRQWGQTSAPSEVERLFHIPTARIHQQRIDDRPLAQVIAAHGDRCLELGAEPWMTLPVAAGGALENRAIHRVLGTGRMMHQSMALVVPMAATMLVASLVLTAPMMVAVQPGPPMDEDLPARVFLAAAPGVGFVAGASVGFVAIGLKGMARLIALSITLPTLALSGGGLVSSVVAAGALSSEAITWMLLGLLGGVAIAVFGHVLGSRMVGGHATPWDSLDGTAVLQRYAAGSDAGGDDGAVVSEQDDPVGLAGQGWKLVGVHLDRQLSRGWSIWPPKFEPGLEPVTAARWLSPDGRILAKTLEVDGLPFVSLLSRATDGRLFETRSLPDPGTSGQPADPPIRSEDLGRLRSWPTAAYLAVSSRPSKGLTVSHVEGTHEALRSHVADVVGESLDVLRPEDHKPWSTLKAYRPHGDGHWHTWIALTFILAMVFLGVPDSVAEALGVPDAGPDVFGAFLYVALFDPERRSQNARAAALAMLFLAFGSMTWVGSAISLALLVPIMVWLEAVPPVLLRLKAARLARGEL